MPIPFNEIPANMLAPLFYAEIQPAQTPFNASLKLLLVGHRNADGFGRGGGSDNKPYILSDMEARRLFGNGSMLAEMYKKARDNAPFIEIWGVAATPTEGSVAATGALKVKTDPSLNEILRFMIAGNAIEVAVKATDTRAQLATRIAFRINKTLHLPCAAEVNGSDATQVDLTCKWVGYSGNAISISISYWGRDDRTASRMLTVSHFSGGTGSPGLHTALASLGDQLFDVIAVGFQAWETLLDQMDDFMDGQAGRWSPSQQLYGHFIIGQRGTFADLVELGEGRNGPHVSIIGMSGSPHPPWSWASATGAHMTQHWAAPPEISRPEQTLPLRGILPASNMADWFDIAERQSLLSYGISTYRVDEDRTVRLDRLVTNYKTNVWGDPDASWRDAITMFQTMFFVRYLRGAITGAFPRAALTDVDTGIPGFASPGRIKDVVIHAYKQLETLGLVENSEAFAQALEVERNLLDANRVDLLVRPDLVNQLRIVATLVETHLQLDVISPSTIVA